MAKGQQRSNRETKKPKAAAKPTAAPGARDDAPVKNAKAVNDDRNRPNTPNAKKGA